MSEPNTPTDENHDMTERAEQEFEEILSGGLQEDTSDEGDQS